MIGLWLGKTNEGNGWYHTSIIAGSSLVEKLHVVRYKKFDREIINSNRIVYHTFRHKGKFANKFLNIFFKGLKVLRKEKIDFIVTFNVFPYGIISWVLSVMFKKPLALCFVGSDYNHYLRKNPYRFFIIRACKRAEIIICKGSHMIEGLNNAGIDSTRFRAYPHFVHDRWFYASDPLEPVYDIIAIGALIKEKNIDIIVSAIAYLNNSGIRLKACILGEGPEKNKLLNMIETSGLADQIHFAGFQDDVLPYLKKSRVFVQTSSYEGISLALIESLAAGLVPVTTIAGSEKDIITDNHNGLFIRTGDIKDLAEKLQYLSNEANYNAIREIVLKERLRFKYDNAVLGMDKILSKFINANNE